MKRVDAPAAEREPSMDENTPARVLGVLLVAAGVLLNKWVLTALLSPDGDLAAFTTTVIWAFDLTCIALGVWMVRHPANSRRLLRRLAGWYRVAAVHGFSALVLLAGLNLAAAIADSHRLYPSRDAPPHGDEAARDAALAAAFPGVEAADMRAMTTETHEPLEYAPWVQFRHRQRTGRFANISSEGYRHTDPPQASLADPGVRVFLFGGSTTFGSCVDDASTIASHLRRELVTKHPRSAINVFNFGRGYYYSSQELALLVSLLREGHRPDVAVFVDGYNECQIDPAFTDRLASLWRLRWDPVNSLPLGEWLQRFALIRYPLRFAPRPTEIPFYLESHQNADLHARYVRNKEMITALGAALDFRTYFFIQPIPGYRNNFLDHPLMQPDPRAGAVTRRGLMRLLEEEADGQTCFSMTHVLAEFDGQPFVDSVHYSGAAAARLAAFIAERIEISTK